MSNDVKDLINNSPISSYQIKAIAICFIIFFLDGYDALVLAFTGPSISEDWKLNYSELGVLLSSGLIGMALGAIFLGSLADKYGRRILIVTCLCIISLGMFLSAFTQNLNQLAILRLFTGIGIGIAITNVNVIITEYAPDKRRGFVVSVVQIAYPLGAMTGGVVAAVLISEWGWRMVFIVGAFASAVMIPIVLKRLPESIDYLLIKRPIDALQKINAQLRKMGHPELKSLPEGTAIETSFKSNLLRLWSDEFRASTVLMWLGFFMVMFSLYFILSWTPKLLITAGLSTEQGISGGMVMHLGGICGQLALGYLSARFKLRKLITAYFFMATCAMVFFALYTQQLTMALIFASGIGFFTFGTITGLFIMNHKLYPAEIRSAAMGWAIGIGRVGAIISPYLAGKLLDLDWQIPTLYFVFSIPMFLGMLVMQFNQTRD